MLYEAWQNMGALQERERARLTPKLNAALDGWLEKTKGKRAATRGLQTQDRDAQNTYVQIVEFPSYEEAMANSKLPHDWSY